MAIRALLNDNRQFFVDNGLMKQRDIDRLVGKVVDQHLRTLKKLTTQ